MGFRAGAAQEAVEQQARNARLDLASSMRRFWGPEVSEQALPLIEAIAEGRLTSSDATVRERARNLETQIRQQQTARLQR